MAQRGINKAIIIGNLGQDPETRHMPSGDAVTNLSVATSEVWKDKQSGQQQERTEWHRIVVFGKAAEIVAQYARKGSKMYFEGKLRTRKWQDQSGADRYSTEIVVDMEGTFQFLSSQGEGGGQQQGGQSGGNQQRQPAPQAQPGAAPAGNAGAPPSFDNFDDDIPF